jgi:predicted dehydrogenase
MQLSLVVPVYKEEGNIPVFLRRIREVLAPITDDYEIIFSLDPSPDRTEDVILEARATDPRICLLKFSRRFGQPMATLAGMEYSRGDAVIVFTPDNTHFAIASAAVARGLHVLVAKPVVKTLAEHAALAAAVAAAGDVVAAVEYHKRWDPIYSDARERAHVHGAVVGAGR